MNAPPRHVGSEEFADPGPPGSARILVADDDRVVQALLNRTLRKAGYDVVLAANGREALDRMESDVGVMLLDIQMPEMDGIRCLGHLREQYPDLAVIMISASEEIANAVEAMRRGAYDYVVKPVAPGTLIPLIEKARRLWIQNRRFRKMEAELARARAREIDIAAKIQRTLLMGEPPRIPGLRIACHAIPSRGVDGDFYDFFRLDDHSLDILIGDVMGKGIAAALLGAAVKNECLRVIGESNRSTCGNAPPEPEAVIDRLHRGLIDHLEDIETFVTLCYARLDLRRREIRMVDCGHTRTLHYRASERRVVPLEGFNVPLGLPESEPFRQIAVRFSPGDVFLFYSDGLTEARGPDDEMFGEDRLVALLREEASPDPEALIRRIDDAVARFAGGAAIDDDMTCVAAALSDAEPPLPPKETEPWPTPASS